MRAYRTVLATCWMALSLLLLVSSSYAAGTDAIVLRPAAILDVEAGQRLTGKLVIVRGDKIEAVRDAAEPLPADAEVIDLPGATLLPGLIDAHVHLAWAGPAAAGAVVGKDEAKATLEAGFTTVRNLDRPRPPRRRRARPGSRPPDDDRRPRPGPQGRRLRRGVPG